MNPCVLTFHLNGTGTCLYSELVDLQSIGSLQIERATTIEFNNQTQFWEVKDRRCKVLYFSRQRAACLAWEQKDFNR